MNSAAFPLTGTDEEFVEFVIQRYFLPEELEEAQQMVDAGGTYEEAVAYLVKRGQETLRHSGEEHPPHLFITIPGGKVFAHHPQHPWPQKAVLACSLGYLASRAFPPPAVATQSLPMPQSHGRYQTFSLFDEVEDPTSAKVEQVKRPNQRTKRLKFIAQPVRMGTKKAWWERSGWVIKDGPLGYAIESMKQDFHGVSLVHLKSNRVMVEVYLFALDETTHQRIQAWVAEVLTLTDWTQGIAVLLKERKKQAWTGLLEELWHKYKNQRYQFSLFDAGAAQ